MNNAHQRYNERKPLKLAQLGQLVKKSSDIKQLLEEEMVTKENFVSGGDLSKETPQKIVLDDELGFPWVL